MIQTSLVIIKVLCIHKTTPIERTDRKVPSRIWKRRHLNASISLRPKAGFRTALVCPPQGRAISLHVTLRNTRTLTLGVAPAGPKPCSAELMERDLSDASYHPMCPQLARLAVGTIEIVDRTPASPGPMGASPWHGIPKARPPSPPPYLDFSWHRVQS